VISQPANEPAIKGGIGRATTEMTAVCRRRVVGPFDSLRLCWERRLQNGDAYTVVCAVTYIEDDSQSDT
jgi:hypothetical protein